MNEGVKNLLGMMIIITLAVAAFVLFRVSSVYDRSSEPTNFRSFTVQADGKASSAPDIAEFSFQVITEGGADVAKLQSDNAIKMNGAIDYVKKQGIKAEDIKTEQYSISPRYETVVCDYTKPGTVCPPAKIAGYTIQQSVRVKIRDFKVINALLTGVVESGANSVSEVSFTLDDPSGVEDDARAEAIKKAQAKAESIARAGGFSLGRLLEISEGSSYIPYYSRGVSMDMAQGGKAESIAPTIEPGSQDVSISVSLKYEIR